jgi:hypothetical protein
VGGSGPDERRGGGEHADTGGDARETAVADRVAAAAAELYGADPEAFTERRKALAASAKSAGGSDAAAAIAALRKPTRAAWVVNRLARADPDAAARLADLAAALRAAEQSRDGPRLRELSAERGALIDALTARALAAAGVHDPPTALRDEVAATLTAALADPGTAADFAAGTLTKAAHWSGFGFGFAAAGLGSADGAAASANSATSPANSAVSSADSAGSPVGGSTPEPTRPSTGGRASRAATAKRGGPSQARPPDEVAARRAAQQQRAAQERRKQEEERRAAEQQERLAREAADRDAELRKNYEDGERTVVSAATASAEAGLAEDRLAAEVRDLEERLTKARDDLAAARRRARHAEAAERRARQALDRLPRPLRRQGVCSRWLDCLV